MTSRLTREQLEIYELGELEREAARMAQFLPVGSWLHRYFLWCERTARECREELRDQVRESGM